MGSRWFKGALGAGVALASLSAGCVSLEEYDQLKMAHRTLQGEKEQLYADLMDCRSASDVLRSKVEGMQGELNSKSAYASSLQQEADRAHAAFKKAQDTLEEMAKRYGSTTEPIVIEKILPPALDTALRDFASKYPDRVEYDAGRGTVKWKSDLLFASGSAVVVDAAKEPLRSFSEVINSAAAQGFEIIVVGHTDDVPIKWSVKEHPSNWHLSVHRSISVMQELVRDGISSERVGVMGFGEFRPIVANSSDANRALNRRVEIYIVPQGIVGAP